jgi:putative flippase GtrA
MNSGVFRQFILFVGVGAIGTSAQYVILIFLVEVLVANAILASTLGFMAGALINYYLNYKYTFSSKKLHIEAASKFFTVALIGAGSNSVIMSAGIELWRLNYILAQIIATGAVLVQNFVLNKYWAFAPGKVRDEGSE